MTIKEMREKRGQLAAQMTELVNAGLTAENRTQFDAMDHDQAELKEQIDRAERAAALEVETRMTARPTEDQVGEQAARDEEKRNKAFRRYLTVGLGTDDAQRLGVAPLDAEERSTVRSMFRTEERTAGDGIMGSGGGNALTGSGGGYFVPIGFINKIEEALKWFGGMLEASTIMDTATGQPLPYPTDNDTANMGELVGENVAVGTQEVTLGNVVFGAYKFSTKLVRVSFELLQDSAFDLETFLAKKFATRLGRVWNYYFTVGSGVSQPKGIVAAAADSAVTVVGDDNATTATPTTQIGQLDLINLEHSVDKAYRVGAKYMMSDYTQRYLKTLKDKYGRLLWAPGIAAGAPDTINNYPYLINNDMATLAQTSPASIRKTVLFGALDKYMIRRVKQLSVLRLSERYAEFGQVGFIGFARADGNLLDAGTNPVKYLANPAS